MGVIKNVITTMFKTEGAASAVKETDAVGRAQTRLADASASSGRKMAAVSSGLGGFVAAYAGAAATLFALSSAFETLNSAARVENIIKGTNALAASVASSGPQIIKTIKDITNGQISLEAAATNANIALSAGFSTKQIDALTTAAFKTSKALGRDLTDSMTRLVRGTAKLEPELLDELGIFVRIDPAVRAYARQLGVAATSLTEFQRRQAFLNAVVAESSRKFSMINTSAPSAQQSLEKLMATVTDLGVTLAGFLANFLKPIADFFNGDIGNSVLLFGGIMLMVFGKAKSLVGDFVSTSMKNLSESVNKAILDNEKFGTSYEKLIAEEKAFQAAIATRGSIAPKTDPSARFGSKGVPRDMASRFSDIRNKFNEGVVSSLNVEQITKMRDTLDKDLKELATKGVSLGATAQKDVVTISAALNTMLASTTMKTKILTTAFVGLERGILFVGNAATKLLSAFNWVFMVTTAIQLLGELFGFDLYGTVLGFFSKGKKESEAFSTGVVGAFESAAGGADKLTTRMKALGASKDNIDNLAASINDLYSGLVTEAAKNRSDDNNGGAASTYSNSYNATKSRIEEYKTTIAESAAIVDKYTKLQQEKTASYADAINQANNAVAKATEDFNAVSQKYGNSRKNSELQLVANSKKALDQAVENRNKLQDKLKTSLNFLQEPIDNNNIIINKTKELLEASELWNKGIEKATPVSTITLAQRKLDDLKAKPLVELTNEDKQTIYELQTVIKMLKEIPEGGLTLIGDISAVGGVDAGKLVSALKNDIKEITKDGAYAGLSIKGITIEAQKGVISLSQLPEEMQDFLVKTGNVNITLKDMNDAYLAGAANAEAMGSQLAGIKDALALSDATLALITKKFVDQGVPLERAKDLAKDIYGEEKLQLAALEKKYEYLNNINTLQKGMETAFNKETKVLDTAQWEGLVSLSGKFASNQLDIAKNQAEVFTKTLDFSYVDRGLQNSLELKKQAGTITDKELEQLNDLNYKEGLYNSALKTANGILLSSRMELAKMVTETQKQIDAQSRQNDLSAMEQRLALAQAIQTTEQQIADIKLDAAKRALDLEKQRNDITKGLTDNALKSADNLAESLKKLSEVPATTRPNTDQSITSDIDKLKKSTGGLAEYLTEDIKSKAKEAGDALVAALQNPKIKVNPELVDIFVNQYKQIISGMTTTEQTALAHQHAVAMQEIVNEQKKTIDQIKNLQTQKLINNKKADVDKAAIEAEALVVRQQIEGYGIFAKAIDSWNKGVSDLATVLQQYLTSLPKSLGVVNNIKTPTPTDLVSDISGLIVQATAANGIATAQKLEAISAQTNNANSILDQQISGLVDQLKALGNKKSDEASSYNLSSDKLSIDKQQQLQELTRNVDEIISGVQIDVAKLIDDFTKQLKDVRAEKLVADLENALSLTQERMNLENTIAQIGLDAQERQLDIEKSKIALQTQYMDNALQQLNILDSVLSNIKEAGSSKKKTPVFNNKTTGQIVDEQRDTTKARLDTFANSVGNPKPLLDAQAKVLELMDKSSKSAKDETNRKLAVINYEIAAKKAIFALEIGQQAKEHQLDMDKLLVDQKNTLAQIKILGMQQELNKTKAENDKAAILAEADIILQQLEGYKNFASVVDSFINDGVGGLAKVLNGFLSSIPGWLGGGGKIDVPGASNIAGSLSTSVKDATARFTSLTDERIAAIDANTKAANDVLKTQSDALWAHFAENNQKGMDAQTAYELAVQQTLATQQNALDGLAGSAANLATSAAGGTAALSDLDKKLLALFDSVKDQIKTALNGFNDALFYRDADTSFKDAMNDVLGNMFKGIQQNFFEQTIATPVSDFLTQGIFGAMGVDVSPIKKDGTRGLSYKNNSLLVMVTNWDEQDKNSIGNFDPTKKDGKSWWSTLRDNIFGKDSIFTKLFSGLGGLFKNIFGGIFGSLFGGGGLFAASGGAVHLAQGGKVDAKSHLRDKVNAMLEPDEFIMRKVAAKKLGYTALNYMNATGNIPENTTIATPMIDKTTTNNQIGESVMKNSVVTATPGPVHVNVANHGTGKEVEQQKPRFDGDKYVVDIILRDLQNNGPIRKSLRS